MISSVSKIFNCEDIMVQSELSSKEIDKKKKKKEKKRKGKKNCPMNVSCLISPDQTFESAQINWLIYYTYFLIYSYYVSVSTRQIDKYKETNQQTKC